VLSGAQTTPLSVRDGINVNDHCAEIPLSDLRPPSMHEPIGVRSKICQVVRDYYDDSFCGDRDSYAHQIHARGRRDY
jgi:aspartyl-tRNA synthetase